MKAQRTLSLLLLVAGLAAAARAAEAEVLVVGFDKLASYEFAPPEDPAKAKEADAQIPAKVREFNDKKVAVTGFMLPVKMDGGLVTEFLLVKDPMMCCYGVMPKVTEWVVVKMAGAGVKPLMDVPITFLGKLRVGEIMENGYLTGIYLLEGDKLGETKS